MVQSSTENTNVSEESFVGASLLSMMSGNPNGADITHRLIEEAIDGSHYTTNIQPFLVECNRIDDGQSPYKTLFALSPHGGYILVRTKIPINIKGDIDTKPGYALLFSQHPEFLRKLFTVNKEDRQHPPSDKEIEAKVSVISARYEHDILHTDPESGERSLITSWVRTEMDRHNSILGPFLKSHGSLLKNIGGVFRSASCVFWLENNQDDPEKNDIYCYSNPYHGKDRLFMKKKVLEHGPSKFLLKAASHKIDAQPCNKEKAYQIIHEEFTKISRGFMHYEDPHDTFKPDNMYGKVKHSIKTGSIRTVQRTTNALANMKLKTLLVVASVSGSIVLITKLPLLLLAGKANANVIIKGGQAATRAVTKKLLSSAQPSAVNFQKDVESLLSHYNGSMPIVDENRGTSIKAIYIDHTQAIHSALIAGIFPDAINYNKQHRREWGMARLLNPTGYQPGNIFSAVKVSGQTYLRAKQSNGLDIYYNPKGLSAFAHQARPAYEHASLEDPIKILLDELPDQHSVIGVRHSDTGKLEMETFSTLRDVPESFTQFGSKTIESLEKDGIFLDQLKTSQHDFPLVQVLPESEGKKVRKKALNDLSKTFKGAFDPCNPLAYEVEENIHALCIRNMNEMEHYSEYTLVVW